MSHLRMLRNSNESGNGNEAGEDTSAGALRAPRAGSPDCVVVFGFVFVYVKFELRKDLTLPVARGRVWAAFYVRKLVTTFSCSYSELALDRPECLSAFLIWVSIG